MPNRFHIYEEIRGPCTDDCEWDDDALDAVHGLAAAADAALGTFSRLVRDVEAEADPAIAVGNKLSAAAAAGDAASRAKATSTAGGGPLRRSAHKAEVTIDRVVSPDDIARVSAAIRSVPISDSVMRYALRLVRSTRVGEADGGEIPRVVRDYVSWGAGPRASEYLILGAKARALFAGMTHATPEHVREVAMPVLRHRVLLNFNAEADQVTTEEVIGGLIEGVPVEESPAAVRAQMDDVYG